jgi:hypothetical protein
MLELNNFIRAPKIDVNTGRQTLAMFGWQMLVLVVVFNTFKLTHNKLTP